jgi:succinyl-diaminopimelate desuccinylase
LYNQISEYIESQKEELVELVQNLVKIPTVNPPGDNYDKFSQLASNWLSDAGITVEVVEIPKESLSELVPYGMGLPRFNILGRLKGSGGYPVLCLNGHYDVVPVGTGWSKEPFSPVIENGRIYGRGSCDTKGGIAAMMMAVKAISQCKVNLKGELIIALTPDEELSSGAGVSYLLNKELIKPQYAIITEPTGPKNIVIGQKGGIWGEISVKGKSSHAAIPFAGENAFIKLVEVADSIEKKFKPFLAKKKSKYKFLPGEDISTITLGGKVQSGQEAAIIPNISSMSFDYRIIPDDSVDDGEKLLLNFIENLNKENPNLKIGVTVWFKGSHYVTSSENDLCRVMRKTIKENLLQEPIYTVSSVWAETTYFIDKGVQAVTYGPGRGGIHAEDESVLIEDLVATSKVFADTSVELLT